MKCMPVVLLMNNARSLLHALWLGLVFTQPVGTHLHDHERTWQQLDVNCVADKQCGEFALYKSMIMQNCSYD